MRTHGWSGVTACIALAIAACGGDPATNTTNGDSKVEPWQRTDLQLGPVCQELQGICGKCTAATVKDECTFRILARNEERCGLWRQDPGNRVACGETLPMGRVSVIMWRPDSPQGEIAVDSNPNGPLWMPYEWRAKRNFQPSDIPQSVRTGKMTPATIELPEGRHLLAFYREGYVTSVHPITITAGGTVNVNDGRLALDLVGTMWVQVEGSWVGIRSPITKVDVTSPSCGLTDHEHGDACIWGDNQGMGGGVLLGSRIFYHPIGGSSLDGSISDDRRRMEYDVASARDPASRVHFVWQRE